MKKSLLTILLSVIFCGVFAAHIKGGFFTYKYLGPGSNNTNKYRITLTVYMVCNPSSGQLSTDINFTVFHAASNTQYANAPVKITRQYQLSKTEADPCIIGDQLGCYYTIVQYELDNYELPVSTDGYRISYQRCCRIASMDNVENSATVGNTYSIVIPGTSSPVPNADKNSSPIFAVNDVEVVCEGSFFSFDLSAVDPDGDSLTYILCTAYDGGSTAAPAPDSAAAAPYNTVNYSAPFSGGQPMGNKVKIDPKTGILSGIAPSIAFTGEYVVTACVTEYRNGVYLAESRKELHIRVRDCVLLKARLDPKPVTCDGFKVSFYNGEVLPSTTLYRWNFGDPASDSNNISTSTTPTHTYSDTGRYTVKLWVSTGNLCSDSTTLIVKVYPGFFPALKTNPPYCKGVPVSFQDITTTKYGVPTGWRWNFGVANDLEDTSNLKNPSFTYPASGQYKVQLIVGNTFGCIDTVTTDVTIVDKPPLTVIPKDTTYCALDSVQLKTVTDGPGIFTWTPASSIQNANSSSPVVFPQVATRYYVTFNQNGCLAKDSVLVNPTNDVDAIITASTINICQEDTLTLTGSSKYSEVTWHWTPEESVATPSAKITKAYPEGNAQYNLQVNWGRCKAVASKIIAVTPLAIPNAGPDAAICRGQATAQLQAKGGNTYQWLPATGLNRTDISNPVANPDVTTTYKVTVGVAGCSKTKIDSVTVLVRELPDAKLTNDTLICSIDTLQLQTNAAGTFVWSPNYMISSLSAPKPLVSPDVPTTYRLTLTDIFGCVSMDSVKVDVKLFVTLDLGNDTTICRTDAVVINTKSDALSYKWTPDLYLSDASAKQPVATPEVAQITYRVIANIGKCQSNDSITIKTVPYPIPNAGNDTTICFGSSTQLSATGGSAYIWTPVTFLSNSRSSNPTVIKPLTDTRYTVSVTDILGCPKAVTDDVWIRVYPIVQAKTGITDTSIVLGQTLQMNGSGGDQYEWSPATWLTNTNTANPVAAPEDNIEYKLLVTVVPFGCTGRDSVKVKVYKVPPSFYVPTAFSPNGDGNNEVLRPIALGMRSIRYFKVFNRLGQLMFSTTERNKGWDGTYKGNPQDPATFVWMAQGETYTGEFITRKGSAVLVR